VVLHAAETTLRHFDVHVYEIDSDSPDDSTSEAPAFIRQAPA